MVLWFRKQLCGPGETIQSYNHQSYHKPQLLHKHGGHLSQDNDDIDVGKVGDEIIKHEGKHISFIYILSSKSLLMGTSLSIKGSAISLTCAGVAHKPTQFSLSGKDPILNLRHFLLTLSSLSFPP